ncbi:hypothetical protein ACJX0J_041074, partial [Zea mays]
TKFMVDMKCEGCVTAVKNKLQTLEGIKNIEVDLSNQVVRVLGSRPVKIMLDVLYQTGREARLIGQGNPNDFLVSAAVAEFKGPVVFGVVRLAQVNMELARVEATFSGLSPGEHGWSINQFGDLTRGAESTGNIYNPPDHLSDTLQMTTCWQVALHPLVICVLFIIQVYFAIRATVGFMFYQGFRECVHKSFEP